MSQDRQKHQYDDGTSLAQRYSASGRRHRVTFGPKALLLGTAVTHFLIAAGVVAAMWSSADAVFVYSSSLPYTASRSLLSPSH